MLESCEFRELWNPGQNPDDIGSEFQEDRCPGSLERQYATLNQTKANNFRGLMNRRGKLLELR